MRTLWCLLLAGMVLAVCPPVEAQEEEAPASSSADCILCGKRDLDTRGFGFLLKTRTVFPGWGDFDTFMEGYGFKSFNPIQEYEMIMGYRFNPHWDMGVLWNAAFSEAPVKRMTSAIDGQLYFRRGSLLTAGFGVGGRYKLAFLQNRLQWHVGADLGVYLADIRLKETSHTGESLFSGSTVEEEFRTASLGAKISTGIAWRFRNLVTVGWEFGYRALRFDKLDWGGETYSNPDLDLSGAFGGFTFGVLM